MINEDFTRFLDRFCELKDYVAGFEKSSKHEYLIKIYADEHKFFSRPVSISLSEDNLIIAFSIIGKCPTDELILWNLLEENKDGHYTRSFIMDDNLVRGVLFPIEYITPEIFGGILLEIAQKSHYYLNKYF